MGGGPAGDERREPPQLALQVVVIVLPARVARDPLSERRIARLELPGPPVPAPDAHDRARPFEDGVRVEPPPLLCVLGEVPHLAVHPAADELEIPRMLDAERLVGTRDADDIEAERARIVAAGYQPKDVKTMTHDGKPFGKFFFIDDPDGYKIEVLQRGGRFQ